MSLIFGTLVPSFGLWLFCIVQGSARALDAVDYEMFDKTTEVINSSYRFQFSTCTQSGRVGPTQYQCDRAYQFMDINVTVLMDPPYAGVQVWTVPKTAIYSITALGASGGNGADIAEISKGGYVSGKYNLSEGEQIYMLIGQRGQSVCDQTTEATKPLCLYGVSDHDQDRSTGTWNPSTSGTGGGGGGGGGTFVFKIDPETRQPVPLVIAGGGGGHGLTKAANPINSDGGLVIGGDGRGAYTANNGAGGGGGWYGKADQPQAGTSLLCGGAGGSACRLKAQQIGWQMDGGFGGGGGGCNSGGGGGGYSGGNVSLTDDPEHNGMGGSSFISRQAESALFEEGIQEGDGEVEIAFIFDCQCDFLCIYFNEETKRCYCPPNYLLAEDGKTCLNADKLKKISENKMILITISSVVGVVVIIAIILLIVPCRNRCKLKAIYLKHLKDPDYQLDHLHNVLMPRNMEYNPNYDFGGAKCSLKDLRQIPRQHLLLIRALGHGAFGEVYEGYLSNLPPEAIDMQVAVKTLSILSSDQAESDFLMEALMMSKFDHPNIVKFVGVCFEKNPRFIILELLEGGDLKNFLRECRPKENKPSPLNMLDLVNLSLDIAKGCQYLEANHFVHRDIAARNCLLTTKGPDRIAKIADFGMARDIYRADYYHKEGKAMLPVKWMPPEAFVDGIFTTKTDVWSFGILLWEVFSLGYVPYPGRGNHEVMQLVTAGGRLDPPRNCPPAVHNLMKECWNHVAEQRPRFTLIVNILQEIAMETDLADAPLPVSHGLQSIDRYILAMKPPYPDIIDPTLFGDKTSNSLEELLRPLETGCTRSGLGQRGQPARGNIGDQLNTQTECTDRNQPAPSGDSAGINKPRNPEDPTDEESKLLLDKETVVLDGLQISSGFDDPIKNPDKSAPQRMPGSEPSDYHGKSRTSSENSLIQSCYECPKDICSRFNEKSLLNDSDSPKHPYVNLPSGKRDTHEISGYRNRRCPLGIVKR